MSLADLIRDVHSGNNVKAALEVHVSQDRPSNRSIGWHPSEFCDMCARESVIRTVTENPRVFKVSTGLQRIFDLGTAMHEWYQNRYLGPAGILWGKWGCSRCKKTQWGFMPKERCSCAAAQSTAGCASRCKVKGLWEPSRMDARGGCIHCGVWGFWEYLEIPVRFTHPKLSKPIVGHSDGLVKTDVWRVLEMKSINDWGFNLLPEARSAHRNQAEIYGQLIRMGGADVPEGVQVPKPEGGVVLYMAKNTSEEKEFPFDLDEERARRLLTQPVVVEHHLSKMDRLPPNHPECDTILSKRAGKCGVKGTCFGKKTLQQISRLS